MFLEPQRLTSSICHRNTNSTTYRKHNTRTHNNDITRTTKCLANAPEPLLLAALKSQQPGKLPLRLRLRPRALTRLLRLPPSMLPLMRPFSRRRLLRLKDLVCLDRWLALLRK